MQHITREKLENPQFKFLSIVPIPISFKEKDRSPFNSLGLSLLVKKVKKSSQTHNMHSPGDSIFPIICFNIINNITGVIS